MVDQRRCEEDPGHLHKAPEYEVKKNVVAVQVPGQVHPVKHEGDAEVDQAVEDGDKGNVSVPGR